MTNPEAPDFGVYVHIPFCARRCGYCDFNTYEARKFRQYLLAPGACKITGLGLQPYSQLVLRELELATENLGELPVISTVFIGGGTPTILPPGDLIAILNRIRQECGLARMAEVTVEANPDSVTEASINELAAGGITRISLGMQSAVPRVLATLDRTHEPAAVPRAVTWAKAAGLRTSVDLIYGTPGESHADWERSVQAAIATGVEHVSAYALTIHEGTRLFRQVERGELSAPDDDDQAEKYELCDTVLSSAGLDWYEISNWALGGIAGPNVCRHNLGYWRGGEWLGLGPGAHSYLAAGRMSPLNFANEFGVRWWNVLHPQRWAGQVNHGRLPVAGGELLTAEQAHLERVLLETRLADGMPVEALESSPRRDESIRLVEPAARSAATVETSRPPGAGALGRLVDDGLIEAEALVARGRIVLTRRGRLLADTVTLALSG